MNGFTGGSYEWFQVGQTSFMSGPRGRGEI